MGDIAFAVGFGSAAVWSGILMVTDLRTRRLPNLLTLPAALLAVAWFAWHSNIGALCGALAWWALCVVPGWASHRLTIGGGDAKLSVSLGAIASACGGCIGWYVAVGCASVVTLALATHPRCRRQRAIPHGPGMLIGTWLSVLLLG